MIRTITPIFSIVVALVVFFTYTKPMFAKIQLLGAEREQYEEAVARAEELNRELDMKLGKKDSFTADQIDRLEALVPTEVNEVKVLTDLSEIAKTHNLLFGNASVIGGFEQSDSGELDTAEQTVLYSDFEATTVTFSLIGTYEQFKAFLGDVERSLVLMEVANIDFTSGTGDLQQYEMAIKVHALPPLK